MIRSYWNHRRPIFGTEYDGQAAKARAMFRATVNVLRDRETIEGWCRPDFDRLGGPFRDLGKLRFKADGTQHRPLGFFGPGLREFTFLVWATERDSEWRPPEVRETAMDRMRWVLADPTRAHELDF